VLERPSSFVSIADRSRLQAVDGVGVRPAEELCPHSNDL